MVLHGYGGSGALFYPVFQHLIDHFHLIFVDIIGMGSSARPKDFWSKNMSPEESNDYFVNYLEKWRVNMRYVFEKIDFNHTYQEVNLDTESGEVQTKFELKNFILCGHSFGGYIAGNYALNYE